jgi:hypothetical protein
MARIACVTVVLVVPCLLFADGGVSARSEHRLWRSSRLRWLRCSGWPSVLPHTKAGVVTPPPSPRSCRSWAQPRLHVRIRPRRERPWPRAAAMSGVHVVIGICGAVISALTVGAVMVSRIGLRRRRPAARSRCGRSAGQRLENPVVHPRSRGPRLLPSVPVGTPAQTRRARKGGGRQGPRQRDDTLAAVHWPTMRLAG